MALETIELEGGWQVTVDYDYDPGQSGGHWDEEPMSPSVKINNIWAVFTDANDKLIQVDILVFLIETGLIDQNTIEEELISKLAESEPDPDQYRDDL